MSTFYSPLWVDYNYIILNLSIIMRFFYVISVLKMVSALTWMIHSDSSTQSMLNGHFKASLAKVYGRVRKKT